MLVLFKIYWERFLDHNMDWPPSNITYANMMQIVDRFNTHDSQDLVGVYEALVGTETCDSQDNVEAVDTYEDGAWLPVLEHSLSTSQSILG